MIEDLDGTTVEPARRRHVLALSGGVAALSLALLLALIVPLSTDNAAPVAASPVPGASGGVSLTIVSNPLNQMRIDLSRTIVCGDGTRLTPPYFVITDDRSGRISAVGAYAGTAPVPVVLRPSTWGPYGASEAWSTGWMTVTCATPGSITPVE